MFLSCVFNAAKDTPKCLLLASDILCLFIILCVSMNVSGVIYFCARSDIIDLLECLHLSFGYTCSHYIDGSISVLTYWSAFCLCIIFETLISAVMP